MRTSQVLMLMVLPLCGLTVAGCGGGSGAPPSPVVNEAMVAPAELRFTGGEVNITARVTATVGVAQVQATVTGPGGSQDVALALDAGQYGGVWLAPPNGESDAQVYTVQVTVRDARNRTDAHDAGEVTVQAAKPPPADEPPGF